MSKDKESFEIDKWIGAIIVGFLVLLFSANLGSVLYPIERFVTERGYTVDISSIVVAEGGQTGIPDVIDIGTIMAQFDLAKGEQVFKKCAICHTNDKGGANKVGPNLWNILGAKVGISDGFAYSSAMTAKGERGDAWDFEELYRYLYSPKKYVPGTKMAFAGLKRDEDRVNVIMYLREKADKMLAVPAPQPVVEE